MVIAHKDAEDIGADNTWTKEIPLHVLSASITSGKTVVLNIVDRLTRAAELGPCSSNWMLKD